MQKKDGPIPRPRLSISASHTPAMSDDFSHDVFLSHSATDKKIVRDMV